MLLPRFATALFTIFASGTVTSTIARVHRHQSKEGIYIALHIHLPKHLWVYCPGHAGGKGNDRADRLAGKAIITSGLRLGRSEVLRSLRRYMRAQSQGRHHTIDRLEERGVERGSARRSSFKGRGRAIVSQTNIGSVSKATLGKLLGEGVELSWAFPSAQIPS